MTEHDDHDGQAAIDRTFADLAAADYGATIHERALRAAAVISEALTDQVAIRWDLDHETAAAVVDREQGANIAATAVTLAEQGVTGCSIVYDPAGPPSAGFLVIPDPPPPTIETVALPHD